MEKIHIRIGSAHDNQLVIESEGIDAYHLELFSDTEGNVFITDLKTINGTFVNGNELNGYTLLNVGDKVVLGNKYLFRWESYIQKQSTTTRLKIKEPKASIENEQIETANPVRRKKINKQLVVIYSLIIIVLYLLYYVMS